MTTANHVLLTRFNLPTPGVQSLIRAKDGWLRDRMALFETYCLPSVLEQTCEDFTWIVYLDPQSPGWLLDQMETYRNRGVLQTIYRESVSEKELLCDIRTAVGQPGQCLLTTNLDNDDAIAVDFIARLQSLGQQGRPAAIYFTHGLIRSVDDLYIYHYSRNAFNSVFVDWSEARTCWSEWHTDFGSVMPVIEIDGPPAWMQVVHGSNVSNRVKGRRTSPEPYRPRFGSLLDDVSILRRRDSAREVLVFRPSRFVIESGRALAKRAILATMGKEGIDRVQVLLRHRRNA